MLPKCSSWSPCEKLKRKTFAPASINLTIVSRSELAGPRVLTILVFFMNKTSTLKVLKDDFNVYLCRKLKYILYRYKIRNEHDNSTFVMIHYFIFCNF